jgi:hypothetical protein
MRWGCARVRALATLAALALALSAAAAARAQDPPARPLPDQDKFFAEARTRLTGNDLMMSRYSYKERSTELSFNPFGRMGTGPVVVAEVFPAPNEALTYRRVLERDGRPLSMVEIAEQDGRYRAKYEAWQRQLAREGVSAREARLRKDAETRAKEQAQLAEAIDLFTFTMEARDTFEGQPAIVVAFVPRPEGRPHSREGRLAKAFAGRAWIHEFEYELLHLNARAIDDVSFGYGMVARLNRGSTLSITRRRVNGTWYPMETHFVGTGRALLFRKMEFNYHRSYYDYRPYDPAELPQRLGWK